MDRSRQNTNNQKYERGLRLNLKNHKSAILHHTVQGLLNKQFELSVLLNTNVQNTHALFFTEHWLSEDQVLLQINFKLVSKFCR
jgi:hypothetical protein